ncbi:MAG: AraC family transcriptional regulator, partial [Rhizobacter sp.]|nr:AraC family transcriptional regulator [Rhizobacter sp.]
MGSVLPCQAVVEGSRCLVKAVELKDAIGSYESAVIGERFGLGCPPTVLTRTASIAPIGFTRLRSNIAGRDRARDVPAESAFSFHVALQPASVDLWVDGKHRFADPVQPGATFLFDLSRNPVSQIHTTFDILRFYISQASLDELAFDHGIRRSDGFALPCLGLHDPVMHGLAMALLGNVERPNESSALFVDHIGLAFHAHVTGVYGSSAARGRLPTGGLSPWQLRRALEFIREHLDGDPTVAQLAQQCVLSAGYFAYGLRRSAQ